MTILNNDGLDYCARGKVLRKIKKQGYWFPYLQAQVDKTLAQCKICTQYSIRKSVTTPMGQVPLSEGPFKCLTIDYVDMVKLVQGMTYMLILIDRFSRWVESTPTRAQTGDSVLKFLMREIIPRFGIPSVISSDNGTTFIQTALKQAIAWLNTKWKLGCLYHPQSQGIVE